MKCAVCGKEFGEGANCQNCGVDRVTGLGNYSGYNRPSGSIEPYYSSSINGGIDSSKTIVCYACGEIIPSNSKFCPYCSIELYVKCPKCGQVYSSKYPACNQCGTNRRSYYEKEKKDRQKAIENQKKQEEFDLFLKELADVARGIKKRK